MDEDLPHDLRSYLDGHDVFTVRYLRWDGLKNGNLIRVAEDAGFEVFLTADQKLTKQQNWQGRRLAAVTLTAQRIEILLANLDAILFAINTATPGSLQIVNCVKHLPTGQYDLV